MRILFAGTPEVAVPSLKALAQHFDVVAVLTRPDAVRGRGRKLTASPVKAAAQELGIPVLESNPKEPEFLATLADLNIDAAAVVAYGKILPQVVLDAVPHGWYNLHFSLLPQWRGAAPVQRALWNGDTVTGVTVFNLTAGMDTGPILAQKSITIEGRPTSGELLDTLAQLGPEQLVEVFQQIEAGTETRTEQPELADASRAIAQKITVDDAHMDFTLPAVMVDRRLRACNPDPGAWCELHNGGQKPEIMHVNSATPTDFTDPVLTSLISMKESLKKQGIDLDYLEPGSLIVSKKHVWVSCGEGLLELNNITVQGKKPMRAADWARGAHLGQDVRLA